MTNSLREIRLESVDSTIEYAKQHARELKHGSLTVISAERQTSGKGRHGRIWSSPSGNLYLSFCSHLRKDFKELQNCSQLLALTVFQILKSRSFNPTLKWPNDLMLNGKKAAGFLADLCDAEESYLLINSVGLNVNMDQVLVEGAATSLYLESRQTTDLKELEMEIACFYLRNLEQFENEGFAPFLPKYKEALQMEVGTPLKFHVHGQLIEGSFHNFTTHGALELKTAKNGIKTFYSMD